MYELWKALNEYGIYTEEDLREAFKKTKLDIGIFTTPIVTINKNINN